MTLSAKIIRTDRKTRQHGPLAYAGVYAGADRTAIRAALVAACRRDPTVGAFRIQWGA